MCYKKEPLTFNIRTVLEQLLEKTTLDGFLYMVPNPVFQGNKMWSSDRIKKYQSFGAYLFTLDLDQIPENRIPYIYHIVALRILNLCLINLDSGLRVLQQRLVRILDLNYLFRIMSMRSIFEAQSVKARVKTLLKIEIMQMVMCVWMQKS
jgi:hypothetical protein